MKARLVICVFALAFAMSAYAAADQATVLAKIDSASKSVAAKEPKKAAADLDEAAKILTDDTASAGKIAQEIAKGQAALLSDRAKAAGSSADIEPVIFDIMASDAKNLYGAIVPADKGDFAAAAAYVKEVANSASGESKDKLTAAANALSEAAAGKTDKAKAFAQARVTLGAITKLLTAGDLLAKKDLKNAAAYMGAAAEYVNAEMVIARTEGASEKAGALRGDAGELKEAAFELRRGIDTEINVKDSFIDPIERDVVAADEPAAKPAAAAATPEEAKAAADAKAEKKAEKKAEREAEK